MRSSTSHSHSILIRVDANPSIGSGHLLRQLALAIQLREAGFSVTFLSCKLSDGLVAQLQKNGFIYQQLEQNSSQTDVKQTSHFAKKKQVKWIILDGYHFDSDYLSSLKDAGFKLMYVTDYPYADQPVDIYLNQNVRRVENKSDKDSVKLFFGPEYALLRPSFFNAKSVPLQNKLHNITLVMGGADPLNMTTKILSWLQAPQSNNDINWQVIVGPLNPHLAKIKAVVASLNSEVEILESLSECEMVSTFQNSDLVISAAGSQLWELIALQVPFIYTRVVDNQVASQPLFEEIGLDKFEFEKEDPEGFLTLLDNLRPIKKRKEMKRIYQQLNISSQVSELITYLKEEERHSQDSLLQFISFQDLTLEEKKEILTLRNQAEIRQYMLTPDPISLEDHLSFINSLAQAKDKQYKAVRYQDELIGAINLTQYNEALRESHWGIYVAKRPFKGVGTVILKKFFTDIFSSTPIFTLKCEVFAKNTRAISTYERLGFKKVSVTPDLTQSNDLQGALIQMELKKSAFKNS